MTKMDSILTDLSEEALAEAIRGNFRSLLRRMESQHLRWVELPRFTLVVSDIPFPFFNRVMGTRLPPEEADAGIAEATSFFSSRGLPFGWRINPEDTPVDLPKRLEDLGFARDDTPGMAIDLDLLVAPEPPPGLRIEKVRGEKRVRAFCEVMAPAYGLPPFIVKDWTEIMVGMGTSRTLRHYIGHLDGEPVATSTVLLADGVAGLYMVATTPEARGKGLGSYMTVAPLLEARDEGYRAGILHATRMGYPVYERLGFKQHCLLTSYEWSPGKEGAESN